MPSPLRVAVLTALVMVRVVAGTAGAQVTVQATGTATVQVAGPPATTAETLADALARAGDNRPAIERALSAAPADQRAAMEFLVGAMPAADLRQLSAEFLLRQVALAHEAYAQVAWRDQVPRELFLRYVLPYAQGTEPREDWRSGFVEQLLPTVADCRTPGEVARRLNETIFDRFGVRYSTGRRRADQAPSESIEQGMASCTGLSILLADACRACCVPARVVSVRWPHKPGNHTWVEVWDGAAWRFVGAAEPDPKGLDRAWFVGDAAHSGEAERPNRIWAVSFAPTGERFAAGWGGDAELWGIDVTARYVAAAGEPARGADDPLLEQLQRWFRSDAAARAGLEFDRNLDAELATAAGDARLRALAFRAFSAVEKERLSADHAARRAAAGGRVSPFTVREVGERPAGGWGLVIAMHGGGGVKPEVNDQQWRVMQRYYRDHPEAGGYLYCALRAPTDDWNGFYTDYFYPVLERLIRQFVVCDGVDPDRVVAIGYSHGGYGAFALGPKLPHRFAAVHSSAAAPTDGQSLPDGLHTLQFSWMVGGRDTAYGRRDRCERFAAQLTTLREQRPSSYPGRFTLVEDNGHTGLPDRDLLAQLVGLRRTPLPTSLWWCPSDGVVTDHYWLRAPQPAPGQQLEASLTANTLRVQAAGAVGVQALLDARLCDLTQPLRIVAEGASRELVPQPSLRVLCETMSDRGDPILAASWVVDIAP